MPDVPRHAADVAAVEHRLTDRFAEVRARTRIGYDLKSPLDTRVGEIAGGDVVFVRLAELAIDVVVPGVGEVALHALHDAEGYVVDIVVAGAAFDVAAAKLDRN